MLMNLDNSRIPKRIIQVYCAPPGKSTKLPLTCQASSASIQSQNPAYEYILFDSDAVSTFITQHFPEYRAIFNSFSLPIQKFDFFRYLAIYKLGGFYFDLDIFLSKPLDLLLDEECIFPFEELTINEYLIKSCGIDWEIANYGFGSAPGHPFLKAVIENIALGQRKPNWNEMILSGIPKPFRNQFIAPLTTGPGLVTRTLAESQDIQKRVSVLFPNDVREVESWQKFGDFGVHLMQSSWRKRDGFIRSRLARIWETNRRRKLALSSDARGPKRSGDWRSILPPV